MPEVPSLYNHANRPLTSRQISISTAPAGRRNVSLLSSQVEAGPLPPAPPAEDFPMDFDDTALGTETFDAGNPEDLTTSENLDGLPGIKVSVKVPAKRYENSVCQHILLFRLHH